MTHRPNQAGHFTCYSNKNILFIHMTMCFIVWLRETMRFIWSVPTYFPVWVRRVESALPRDTPTHSPALPSPLYKPPSVLCLSYVLCLYGQSKVKKAILLAKERRADSCESTQTRMAAGLRILCLFAAFSLVLSDCYLHNPRGSNNRLNERSANRRNANRMFDSQVSWAGERPLYQLCTLLVRIPIYFVF